MESAQRADTEEKGEKKLPTGDGDHSTASFPSPICRVSSHRVSYRPLRRVFHTLAHPLRRSLVNSLDRAANERTGEHANGSTATHTWQSAVPNHCR